MPACHAGDRRFESGRVRHHRISLRPVRPPGRGVLLSAGSIRAVKRGPLLLVLGLLAIAIVLPITGGELGFGERQPRPRALPAAGPTARAIAVDRDGAPPRAPTASPTSAAASPSASPSAPAATPGPPEAVAIVPVTQYRTTATATTRKEVADVLAGTSTRYDALELVSGETDEILAAARGRPAVRRVAARRGRLGQGPDHGPRQEPQAARVPARRRGRPGRARAGVGRQDALRHRPRDRPRRLAADRDAARGGRRHGLRRRRHLDPLRRRRHHARPGRRADPQDQGQGRGLPVRRRQRGHHQPLLLLLVRLGPAADRAHGRRRGDARAHRRRGPRDRQLREPGARTRSATTRRGRSSPPTRS